MIKLYKKEKGEILYWETWENDDGTHTIHWGKVGDKGKSTKIQKSLFKSADRKIAILIEEKIEQGYEEIDIEKHDILLIEYKVDEFGNEADLEKRYELQDKMDETLGWTGIGHCDGGSIGSGTMEVCCFVVDFNISKKVIQEDLKNTKFSDYTRIYKENE